LDKYFEDERDKAFFVNAQDMGDPSAPGSMLSAAHVSWVRRFNKMEYFGIPKGGMSKVAGAMVEAAQAQGVEIRTDARVDEVLVDDGIARGVRLANGEELRSSIVVSNADPKRTFLSLLNPDDLDPAFIHRIKHLTTRANSVKFLAALKELPDFSQYLGPSFDPKLVTYVKICPSVDYFQASWDACKNGHPSLHPVMHIQTPSIWDPTLAPSGMHVLSSWTLYYPARPREGSWEEASKEVAESIIDNISQYAPNFRKSLLDWTLQTPQDIETHTGMTDGNIRHIDITPQQYFSRRVSYRAPVQHLYLCGSGTHPGGEITGAPGHNAAMAILKDLKREVRGRSVG
ncbi:MAG: phytoene desaturase family protein, partial [Dehalococcoidia bacterium]